MANHDHPIVHIEFSSKDTAESAQFYNKLFGWEMHHMPEMDYWSFLTEENHGGGFNKLSEPGAEFETKAGDVIIYVHTEDLEASMAQAEELGATVLKPCTEIPGMGFYGHFRDLAGNRVGLFQGVEHGQEAGQGQEQTEGQLVTA